MIGHAIDVPADAFWGIDRGNAANVDALMKVITDPGVAEQAIGIISADYYDDDRANLKRSRVPGAAGRTARTCRTRRRSRRTSRTCATGTTPSGGRCTSSPRSATASPCRPRRRRSSRWCRCPNIPQALARRVHRLEPRAHVRHAGAAKRASSGPSRSYAPPFECGCYFEASPSVNGAAPSTCTPLQHRKRLHRPRTPRVQPRLLRSPVNGPPTLLEAP